MADTNYQYVYNVNLLDDLHNYFPDLLYDQERFQNVRDILRYIREQTYNRFNLFNQGQRLYEQREQFSPPTPPPEPPAPTPFTQPFVQQHRPDQVTRDEFDIVSTAENMMTTNLLLSMLGANMNTTPLLGNRLLNRFTMNPNADIFMPTGFFSPVVVRPTVAEIRDNSEIGTDISGQSCAICQDALRPQDQCRRLTFCQHIYHKSCIDEWFTRSVACPTCRHDIRNIQ
jgi:hypothetical protein